MKNTKGKTDNEPDVGMQFTIKNANVWALSTIIGENITLKLALI